MLHGKKTRLRAIEKEDIPRFVPWLNNPEIARYLMIAAPLSLADEEDWFQRMRSEQGKRQFVFAIDAVDGPAPVHIGNLGLHDIDRLHSQAMVGIFIGDPAYHGKGYGSDALRTLCRWAFLTQNLHRLYLNVYEFNPRAIRCYEKVGFQVEGRLRQAHFHNGRYWDVLLMAMLREEFQENE